MQTYRIHVAGAGEAIGAIRWELFVFEDVLDVIGSPGSDELDIVFQGQPRPQDWIKTLHSTGYPAMSLQTVA